MEYVIDRNTMVEMNEYYKQTNDYEKVARLFGVSLITVKKCIEDNWSGDYLITKRADIYRCRQAIENHTLTADDMFDPHFLELTDEERADLEELKEELIL